MIQLLKTYQTKLTNLSSGNKSLLQLKTYKYADLDIHEFDFLDGDPSIKVVERLLLKKMATLSLVDDPRSEANNLISKRVRQVMNRALFIQNERGSDDLYLGYPFIEGKLKNGFAIRCPLVFIPVKILEQKNKWILTPNGEASIKINKSFLLAYAHYNGSKYDKSLEELDLSDIGYDDLRSFLTKLYEILKNSNIELNFNQELFEEKLIYFANHKRADYESIHKEGVLKLSSQAILGIYPQSGSYLFSDYDNLIATNTHSSLEDFFSIKNASNLKNKEESFYTPFAMDASQEEAIHMLRSGKSIVVQGPPGTGKSQLIAQVIADYLANGKKVLLTCDKRVALDVVYQRLESIGMQKYIGLVHDYNSDRKKLYEKISHHIENIEHTQSLNNRYDTIAQQRDFLQISRRITQIEEELNAFKKALYDEQFFGTNIKYLYLNSEKQAPIVEDIEVAGQFTLHSLNQLLVKLKYWLPKAEIFEKEGFIFKERKSFSHMQVPDFQKLIQVYSTKNALLEHFNGEVSQIFEKKLSIGVFESLQNHAAVVASLCKDLAQSEIFELFFRYAQKRVRKDRLDDYYQNIITLIKEGIGTTFDKSKLQYEKELLEKAEALMSQNFGKIRYWVQYSPKKELRKVLVLYQIKLQKVDLKQVNIKIDNTLKAIALTSNIQKAGFMVQYEDLLNIESFQDWYTDQKRAINTVEAFNSLPQEYFGTLLGKKQQDFLDSLRRFIALQDRINTTLPELRIFLTQHQIEKFDDEVMVKEQLTLHFESISEFDRFTEDFSIQEKTLAFLTLQTHGQDPESKILNIKNAAYKYWISQIEEKAPILRSVSTGYIQVLEEELKGLLHTKQEISTEIVQLKASEYSYQNLEYNRLGNRTTYRNLHHEATKKKRIMSVRQLFETYSEEILQILPCWMASPETVSAIFPNQEVFDLVIFDEASQCYTEEAVPTLYRGKQILVAGDSKQLPPSDLYKPRWEDEEETIDEQTHSLLDLACRHLPQTMLTEHYRSLLYDLIHFSNEKFYHNKLRMIPEMHLFNSSFNALEYVKVSGIWQNNSNFTEAQECVRIFKNIQRDSPQKTVGIIAFNFKQQELISELLLQDSIHQKYTLPASLFVKNIENVQGDERDIVILSVAYAPNENGKMIQSFGSLALQGGENRLNVAITRAKEKMYVIASILPQQLHTENAKNLGPLLLKEYLQYVWAITFDNYKPNNPKFVNSKEALSTKLENVNIEAGYGFSDLIEYEKNKAVAAIITDDNLYYQSRSAKEIHGYIPQTLIAKNWNLKKKYSREYFDRITK